MAFSSPIRRERHCFYITTTCSVHTATRPERNMWILMCMCECDPACDIAGLWMYVGVKSHRPTDQKTTHPAPSTSTKG